MTIYTCPMIILLVSKIKELRLALILLILYIYSLKALKPDLTKSIENSVDPDQPHGFPYNMILWVHVN